MTECQSSESHQGQDMSKSAILAMKPGHDGALAFMVGGRLEYSIEGEKGSYPRNGPITIESAIAAACFTPVAPDVIALGGWQKPLSTSFSDIGAGYAGLEPGKLTTISPFGRSTMLYTSSHERSHIFGAIAMSPFSACRQLAVLVWEGILGAFYTWTGPRDPIRRHHVLTEPGSRFAALFCIADPEFPDKAPWPSRNAAGKLMALVGLADDRPPQHSSVALVESILTRASLWPSFKADYHGAPLRNCGVTDPEFCRAAKYMSDRLFEIFHRAAKRIFPSPLPLVIGGGCGLNCEWNSRWRSCGLFTGVFVPPTANDSGSAIGTGVDAQVALGGSCEIEWDVYSGPPLEADLTTAPPGWTRQPLDVVALCEIIRAGAVVAWVHGRAEIGPRALGNRSLVASAQDPHSKERLNEIKRREFYRPIAPVALEEDLGAWFDDESPDPYMLYFRYAGDVSAIPSAVHFDGSARVQSVSARSNPRMYGLLRAYKHMTGVGVLCNTSLNYPNRGFINSEAEVLEYCCSTGIREAVVSNVWYRYVSG